MKRITIIGGGASGTLTATNLLKLAGETPLHVDLVEKRSRIGRGVAFGTTRDAHLLNVPCGRMGAFPDDVGGFHAWLVANGHEFDDHAFVPRRLFGAYLRDTFESAAASTNVSIELHDDEAVDLSVDNKAAQVMLRSGEILQTDKVVLAFGNFAPPDPSVVNKDFVTSPRYFKDPWNDELYSSLKPDDEVFVIGTGLSMVDVAIQLNASGHRGKISAISTKGLLPAVHELGHTYPVFNDELDGATRITDVFKTVRKHAAKAEQDSNWRAVIDSLRPATQKLWLDLPLAEKRYFKQHLSRYWNIARHRVPPEANAILQQMQADGRLEILAGRLNDIRHDGRFSITYSNNGIESTAKADVLVNCIGSETNFSRIDSEFVRNLVARRHIRNNELDMGIMATPDGRVFSKNDEYSETVWTLGTALKGTLWETTAIPEIRTQARALALRLLAE
ncbi:MAG TPA: FAD/NAD(P)-binding protein [Pyrinomonadaceae bacterium]|nr:FAD/NAD(P)-binding protein [Pyrinomonadaceae bacterium]